jgi:glycolate oxidase FAD binding subunit
MHSPLPDADADGLARPLGGAGPSDVSPVSALPETLQAWADQVRQAAAQGQRLRLRGGGSKDHLGHLPAGPDDDGRTLEIDTRAWSGIEAHEPSELVVRVRAGTTLSELEAQLAAHGQALAFEPPRYAFGASQRSEATVGGMVACGLSGPSRAQRGAVRDHMLGCTVINGQGQLLRFGGAVMKNVAGFDLTRLMAGSMGTLGLLVDVTLKVLPTPVVSATMRFEMPEAEALQQVNQWAAQPLPVDASAWWDGLLVLRLSGARAAVVQAVQGLYKSHRGELLTPPVAEAFWNGVRDHSDEFFVRARQAVAQAGDQGTTLWRLSVPSTTPPLALHGEQLSEWLGALRWVCTPAPAASIHALMARVGGQAQPFCRSPSTPWTISPMLASSLRLQGQVQRAFDPHGVFDTDRTGLRAAASAATAPAAR